MEEKEEEVKSELLEKLAEFGHIQWWKWSQYVSSQNNLRIETIERWKKLWKPYRKLSDVEKQKDRVWAQEVLEIIKKYPQIGLIYMQQTNHEFADEEREIARDLSNVFR